MTLLIHIFSPSWTIITGQWSIWARLGRILETVYFTLHTKVSVGKFVRGWRLSRGWSGKDGLWGPRCRRSQLSERWWWQLGLELERRRFTRKIHTPEPDGIRLGERDQREGHPSPSVNEEGTIHERSPGQAAGVGMVPLILPPAMTNWKVFWFPYCPPQWRNKQWNWPFDMFKSSQIHGENRST